MNPLIPEAIAITKDLGDVTFIGAVAVLLHVKGGRESQDLDFVILAPLSKEDLEKNGYYTRIERGKETTRTPRGYKIDIYSKRPIKGIAVETIVETSASSLIKGQTIKFASLEVLIVLKHRADRTQDREDLQLLAQRRFKDINWTIIGGLTTDVEFQDLRNAMRVFGDLPL